MVDTLYRHTESKNSLLFGFSDGQGCGEASTGQRWRWTLGPRGRTGGERETHTIYCWALQRRDLHMSQDLSVLVSGRL